MSKEQMIPARHNGMSPMHPGEILKEMYLAPMGLSVSKLATRMQVTTARLNKIVHGKRGITADTALRLGKVFGTSAQMWLSLQSTYELRKAETSNDESIARLEPFDMQELV
ncbi:HigA family addiction module antitoxin [Comamonas guangdongensis]|uniref:HigA family addiction module antitoxin n=1 Tax=Comamonas guangdongensis TaxID=510515 RepID=A0ABV4A0K0_9BURK